MAGIDLTTANSRLQQYLDAEAAILSGQAYTINGRRLERANLAEVQEGIRLWDERVRELAARASGRRRVATGRPNF